jgi:hypothetical protein
MAIPFNCACGKKLQAKDQFGGRRLKCPQCGIVLTIPKPAPARSAAPAKAPASPRSAATDTLAPPPKTAPALVPAAEFVAFVCSCGRKMKARKCDAGSRIDCPTCGRELTIPTKDSDVPPEPKFGHIPVTAPATSKQLTAPATSRQLPPPATSTHVPGPPTSHTLHDPAPARSAADGLFTQSVTLWRDDELRRLGGTGPKEKPVRRLWRPFLLVLLLAAVALGFWFVPTPASKAAAGAEQRFSDLELVPASATSVLTMRVAKFADDETKKQSLLFKFGAAVNKPVNWSDLDLARITVVVTSGATAPKKDGKKDGKKGDKAPPPPSPDQVLYIIRTARAYDQKDTQLRMLVGDRKAEHFGKRLIFVDETENKVLLFVDANVFVLGTPQSIKDLQQARSVKDSKSHPLKAALDAAPHHDLVIGLDLAATPLVLRPFRSSVIWVDETLERNVLTLTSHMDFVLDDPKQAPKQAEDLQKLVDAMGKGAKQSLTGNTTSIDLLATGDEANQVVAMLRLIFSSLHPMPWTPRSEIPKDLKDVKGPPFKKGKG